MEGIDIRGSGIEILADSGTISATNMSAYNFWQTSALRVSHFTLASNFSVSLTHSHFESDGSNPTHYGLFVQTAIETHCSNNVFIGLSFPCTILGTNATFVSNQVLLPFFVFGIILLILFLFLQVYNMLGRGLQMEAINGLVADSYFSGGYTQEAIYAARTGVGHILVTNNTV